MCGRGFFITRFALKEDLDTVLAHPEPFTLGSSGLAWKKWEPDFDPRRENGICVPG